MLLDKVTVEINDDVTFNDGMENFTIAHELGHIVLHASKDKNNNHVEGNVILDNTKYSYLRSEQRVVVGIGINNLIVYYKEKNKDDKRRNGSSA